MPLHCLKSASVLRLVLAILLTTSATFVHGQDNFITASPDSTPAEDHMLSMILTGSAVGTLGFMGGALISTTMSHGSSEYDGMEQALILGSITGGLTLPLGVHYGNKSQGNLGKVMATSLAVGGAGWLILWQMENPALLPMIPLVQLISCIAVESATTADSPNDPPIIQTAEIQESSILVNVVPIRDGMGILFSGTF